MKSYALKAEGRNRAGKGVARALRRENKIPAVIYGDKKDALPISLSSHEVTLEYHKGHMSTMICKLDVDGKENLVLVRDIQLHPVNDRVMHIDFLRVTEATKVEIQVPVHFINQEASPGLKDAGGVLNVVRHELELLCSVMSIPEQVDVDLTGKNIGDAIHMSDVKLPPGTESVIKDRDFTIATIQEPKEYTEEEIKPIEDPDAVAAEGAEGAAAEGAEGDKKDEGDEAKDKK